MSVPIDSRQIAVIAGKEFRDRLRNRWVLAVVVIFTLFALVIAYFGAAQQGAIGVRGARVTIANLVSLVIYLVPLISLMLGYDTIVGEREKGTLELLLSMPMTRLELILGKFLGLALALSVSTLAGFGLAGVVLSWQMGWAASYHYAGFTLSALLMGTAFLSMAVAVSVVASDRVRASGIAIGLWFFYVLVFDLLLLGLLVATDGKIDANLFPLALFLNPADIFRILNVFGMDDVRALYGFATVYPETLANPWLLGCAMVCWILAPLAIAVWRFK